MDIQGGSPPSVPPSVSPQPAVPPEPAGTRFFTAIAILVILLALSGGAAFALWKLGYVSSTLWQREDPVNDLLVTAGNAQTSGDYEEARQIYEAQLGKTKGDDNARVKLRLAVVDMNEGDTVKAVTALREISQDASISSDIRARAAVTALQAYANNATPDVRDALFQGEGWGSLYPQPRDESRMQQRTAILNGYKYALSIGDLFFTRFILARLEAEDALGAAGEEQRALAGEAYGHFRKGVELMKDSKNFDNWPPSQIGYMALEGNRAMIPLADLMAKGSVSDDANLLTESNINSSFEKNISYFDTWSGRDVFARPTGMLARYFYAAYLIQDPKNAEIADANIRGLLNGFLLLSDAERPLFKPTFTYVRARGDESIFANDRFRVSTIALAKRNDVFKQFLIDDVGGWDENDFK